MKLDFIDSRRAYFHATAHREVYVQLPPDDEEQGMCGKLEKSMYGTRDATQNWEACYTQAHKDMGFTVGKASTCVFWHPEKNVRVVVHGDDFTALGWSTDLDWYRKGIQDRMETQVKGRLGPEKHDDKHIRVLNRIVEWTDMGIRYEADQRHAEIIAEGIGLKENSKGVVTPGSKLKEEEGDEKALDPDTSTKYRAMVARANYLAQDRPDIQFATKELCRAMSKPTEGNWRALKRLGRYLQQSPRVVQLFGRQEAPNNIRVFTDTDFAGCTKTRKSTSGGLILFGKHMVKSWSTTQKVVSLSSGEAEYYGMVKGAAQGMGMKALIKDMGTYTGIELSTDSSAAKGMAARKGLGKVRHIEVCQLWLQEKSQDGTIRIKKVKGTDNPADIVTKHVPNEVLTKHLPAFGLHREAGRHSIAPKVAKDS